MKTRKTIISLVLIFVLALTVLTACQNSIKQPLETNLADTAGIRLEQAKQIALANARLAAAQVSFTGTALKMVDGNEIYALQFETDSYSYDYDIAAHDGSIIDTAKKAREGNFISADQARQLALADAGLTLADVSFSKTKLDRDDEKVIYELEFTSQANSYDYEIDASSGQILEVEKKPRQDTGETSPPESTEMIGEVEARRIALADAGLPEKAVTVKKTSQKKDNGREIYEVEFYTDTHEYDYDLDAYSGMIISLEKEQRQTSASTTRPETSQAVSYIGEAKAKQIALQDAGLAASAVTFKKIELDKDSKGTVYEVEFYSSSHKYEYDIDAYSGKIVEKEKEQRKTAGTTTTKTTTESSTTSKTSSTTSSQESQKPAAQIGEAKAKEIALKDAGFAASQVGSLTVELKNKKNPVYYEVEFRTATYKYEYEIEASQGTLLEMEKERLNKNTGATGNSYIGEAKAKELALKDAGLAAGNVRFTDVELEVEGQKAKYEIEFISGNYEYDYDIDARSGDVLEMEKELIGKR